MLGRFLELSVHAGDIRASVEFLERLGFSHCVTNDIWSHPYGVLTDGRITFGLHQYPFASPSLTFVREQLAQQLARIEAAGARLEFRRTGEDVFNEVGFRDPTGHMVTLLEARTYSPADRSRDETSLCGDFVEYSLPARDFAAARRTWEAFGFVALEDDGGEAAYRRLSLTSDHLDLALHDPRFFPRPLLVFAGSDPAARRTRLAALGVVFDDSPPAGLDPATDALFESPDGLAILLRAG